MSKRKTTDDFKKEINSLTNGEYSILGEYKTNKIKIKIRHNCDKCNNYEYEVTPNRFLSGDRCPKCKIEKIASKKRMTQDEFIKILNEKGNNEYKLLNNYKNSKTKVKIKHKTCNTEFEMTPHNFITSNNRCPFCANNMKQNTDIFKERVYNMYSDNYTVLGDYENNNTKILIRHNCNTCNNYEWKVTPRDFLLNKSSCPICSRKERDSKAVREIENILTDKNIIFEREKIFDSCKNIYELPFDFYLEDLNLLIEYDGEFHYRGWGGNSKKLEKQQLRDNIKDKWCEENNIKLIRISYKEKNNLKEIIDEILKL